MAKSGLNVGVNKGKEFHVKITLLEPMLGTAPNDKEVYTNYIASKAPNADGIEEEIASIGIEGVAENGTTVFPRINGDVNRPGIWSYQVRGFFKSGQQMLNDLVPKGDERKKASSGYLATYKRRIDTHVFVKAVTSGWRTQKQLIEIHMPEGGELGICERPLRAQTMQGERVALARSEEVPEGSWLEFDVKVLDEKLIPHLLEWLEFGTLNGLGQWRNSGKGTFVYTMTDKETGEIYSNEEE